MTPNQNKYKKKLSLPPAIKLLLLPIFKSLSDEKLLKKCLHKYTQNDNEAINSVIWKKCPKDIYISKKVLEIAVASAVIELNDGASALLNVFKEIGLYCGKFAVEGLRKKDVERVKQSARKSSKDGQARRKTLRSIAKKWIDDDTEKEADNPSYGTGLF